MRLLSVEKAQGLRPRFMLGLLGIVFRKDSPLDVLKTIYHRPRFFGAPYLAVLNQAMRGPSDWSVADRELFAAFTSKQNECPFCVGSHTAVFSIALGATAPSGILEDWRHAQVDPKVKATLGLIEKVIRDPQGLVGGDFDAVRSEGVRDAAIEDALHIAFCFNIINRLANALDFHVASEETFRKMGGALLKRGYRL